MFPALILFADKNKPPPSAEATAEMQKENANVSALMVLVTKLQKENKQLQKEKEELQMNLTSIMTAKGTVLLKMLINVLMGLINTASCRVTDIVSLLS